MAWIVALGSALVPDVDFKNHQDMKESVAGVWPADEQYDQDSWLLLRITSCLLVDQPGNYSFRLYRNDDVTGTVQVGASESVGGELQVELSDGFHLLHAEGRFPRPEV